jgi:pSer/pThr/pTyr-binding forkhead associated (FHA) protein
LNGSISPAERIFTLSPDRLSILIGRASKSISKGLLGATDNAWFDSPVMSRDHAELVFNTEDKVYPISHPTAISQANKNQTITIQDIGSMHGTYLNTAELARKQPTVLRDGDNLVFGAEVRRGPETFPACAFRVNYKFFPYK